MKPYAFTDELISHIDSGKKVFKFFGPTIDESLQWVHIDKSIIPSLITFPKFSLPTLGQFYRPLEDLHARENGKFYMYAHDFELDMIPYAPFENFILEFSGFDENIFIKAAQHMPEDVNFSKYVLVCQKLHDGILIKPFYYNEKAIDVCPQAWICNHPAFLKYQPAKERVVTPNGVGVGVMLISNEKASANFNVQVGSTMGPEIRALLQFLVVVNMKRGIENV